MHAHPLCIEREAAHATCAISIRLRGIVAGIVHACIPIRTPIGVIRPAVRPAMSFRVERGASAMTVQRWNRREMIQAAGAAGLVGLTGRALAQKPLTAGFIYVGARDDYGNNKSHADAAALCKKMPGLKVVE